MNKPVIITCAPTGGIHTPTMSPHLPITPAEIATASIEAAEAGASIIHLHARDPETGKPDPSYETFSQFLPVIKQATDAVINVSTGAGLGMTMDERLRAATSASPEMASLNMGSMNFGIFPLLEKYDDWKFDWEPEFLGMTRDFIFPNTFATIEYALKNLGEAHNTRFEFECYDLGHLYNVKYFVDKGLIKPPFFIQFVLGILGGAGELRMVRPGCRPAPDADGDAGRASGGQPARRARRQPLHRQGRAGRLERAAGRAHPHHRRGAGA